MVAIAIIAILISCTVVIVLSIEPNLIHDNLTKNYVLESNDLVNSKIATNGSWNQTSMSTKYYDFLNMDTSPYASHLSTESTSSVLKFTNSTMDVFVTMSLTEFRNGEAAKDQFFQDKSGDNGSVFETLDGVDCYIIHVEQPMNNSADILQTLFFHKGSMEGTVYIAGEGLGRGNYSFLTSIAELQVNQL
jgi:hypothetical protein